MATEPTWTVKVDWDNDGNFTGPNDDISADVLELRITGGRTAATDDFRAAQVELKLDNADRKYSRYYSGSPIYGKLLPGRPLLVQADHTAVTYPQFRGELMEFDEGYPGQNVIPTATMRGLDGFETLRRQTIRTALQESKRVDECLGTLLDAAGWAAGRRTHDTALSTLGYWWAHRAGALAAAQALTANELGGQWYMDRSGNSRFENRDYRALAAVFATIAAPNDTQDLAISFRQGDLISRVEYTRSGLSQNGTTVTLVTLSPGGRRINPGSTDPLNTISLEFSGGGKGVISPVAVTDYTANSASDGTGTDKTAQLTVSSFTAYGGGVDIVFNNLDSSPVYLVGTVTLAVRGIAIRQSNEDRIIAVNATAPIIAGQVLSESFDWNDDADAIKSFANYRAATLSVDQPRLNLRLVGNSDAEIDVILGMDVSKRLSVALTGGMYPPGLSGDYFVEGYQLRVRPQANIEMDVTCWSRDQALGNGFRVSDDTPGGAQEYSAIAADAATTGARIWI